MTLLPRTHTHPTSSHPQSSNFDLHLYETFHLPNHKMALRGSIAILGDSIAALRSSRCLSGLRNRAAGECAASCACQSAFVNALIYSPGCLLFGGYFINT